MHRRGGQHHHTADHDADADDRSLQLTDPVLQLRLRAQSRHASLSPARTRRAASAPRARRWQSPAVRHDDGLGPAPPVPVNKYAKQHFAAVKSKIGSKDNIGHKPAGGDKKVRGMGYVDLGQIHRQWRNYAIIPCPSFTRCPFIARAVPSHDDFLIFVCF